MDYVSVKDDLRDRISAFYGVSKVFMADNTTSGGLNNEGMQILVTNRAVQKAQTVYNNYVSIPCEAIWYYRLELKLLKRRR